LLVVGLFPNMGAFVAAALVAHLASAEALGHAEVARVVARPIPVVAMALASVLGPRLMAAAAKRDLTGARHLERVYLGVLAGASLAYVALVVVDWPGNPMALILPEAYVVSWLVPAILVAMVLNQLAVDRRLELTAAGQERRLAVLETLSGGVRMLAAATAAVTGEFAIPLSYASMGIVRALGFRFAAIRHVWSGAEPSESRTGRTLVP
jgi:O-antigen/teichoic acid export membrane protein